MINRNSINKAVVLGIEHRDLRDRKLLVLNLLKCTFSISAVLPGFLSSRVILGNLELENIILQISVSYYLKF